MAPSATSTARITAKSAFKTGLDVRLAARMNACNTTSGLAPGYVQTNLIVLPSRYAADFRQFCERNPVPCPLVAESYSIGVWSGVKSHIKGLDGPALLSDVDMRRDAPKYNVYEDSKLVKTGCTDIINEWTDDHVAFLIGCSFSFETALTKAGLLPRHTACGRNVPMYRTNLQLCPTGVFTGGTFVVSMRPYPAKCVEEVRRITRVYSTTHGEPVAWGWDAVKKLGISDIDVPEWGDAPLAGDQSPFSQMEGSEEEIPVFWGCGVTPQEAVMRAELRGVVMAHAPGHMVLLDCQDSDVVTK